MLCGQVRLRSALPPSGRGPYGARLGYEQLDALETVCRYADLPQGERFLTLLEIDAIHQIHQAWGALGYPFDSLVPSYATAISGDSTSLASSGLAGQEGLKKAWPAQNAAARCG